MSKIHSYTWNWSYQKDICSGLFNNIQVILKVCCSSITVITIINFQLKKEKLQPYGQFCAYKHQLAHRNLQMNANTKVLSNNAHIKTCACMRTCMCRHIHTQCTREHLHTQHDGKGPAWSKWTPAEVMIIMPRENQHAFKVGIAVGSV